MIFLVHALFGAAIGYHIKYWPLAVFSAFLSHYILDLIPHAEYPLKNSENKKIFSSLSDLLKMLTDVFAGFLLIFIFSDNSLMVYTCAFFAVLPDFLFVLNQVFKISFLDMHDYFHGEKIIHFLKNKKISIYWRIFSQLAAVAISIFLLKI